MPCRLPASFRALDNQDWSGCGHRPAHTLQRGSLRALNIDLDELRVTNLARLKEFIDGYSADAEFNSGWVVSMPNQTCSRQVLRDSNDRVASPIRGCSLEQLDVGDAIDIDVSSKGFDIS